MILPLADALQNCFQNLTSRIAGIDNEQMTNRVMGIGSMMGFGLGAIKEQFKTPYSNSSNNNGNNEGGENGLKGFVSRAKSVVNPSTNLSDEKDYDGNINPIRNVIPKSNEKILTNGVNKNIASNIVTKGFNTTKAYLEIGSNLVEGNFNNNQYKSSTHIKRNFQNSEYINKVTNNNANIEKSGDKNEP